MAKHDIISGGNPVQADRAQPLRRKWESPMVILGGCDDTMVVNPTFPAQVDITGYSGTQYGSS